jgi:hypothetical protein
MSIEVHIFLLYHTYFCYINTDCSADQRAAYRGPSIHRCLDADAIL